MNKEGIGCFTAWLPNNHEKTRRIQHFDDHKKQIPHRQHIYEHYMLSVLTSASMTKNQLHDCVLKLHRGYEENFKRKRIFKKNTKIGKIPVRFGLNRYYNLYISETVWILKAQQKDIKYHIPELRFVFPEWLNAAQSEHNVGFLSIFFHEDPNIQRLIPLILKKKIVYSYWGHVSQKISSFMRGYSEKVILYKENIGIEDVTTK